MSSRLKLVEVQTG